MPTSAGATTNRSERAAELVGKIAATRTDADWLAQLLAPGTATDIAMLPGDNYLLALLHGAEEIEMVPLNVVPSDGTEDVALGLIVRSTVLLHELSHQCLSLDDDAFEALMARLRKLPENEGITEDVLRAKRAEHREKFLDAQARRDAGIAALPASIQQLIEAGHVIPVMAGARPAVEPPAEEPAEQPDRMQLGYL